RGPGRVEVGGRDGTHPTRVEARDLEHTAGELEPGDRALVRDVEDAGPAFDRQPSDHRRQVVGEARLAALVVDERELLVLAGEAVADVEGGVVGADHVVDGAGLDDLAPDLTTRAGDEDPCHVAERAVMSSTRPTPRRRAPAPAAVPTSRDARRTTPPSRRGRD